MNLGDVRVGDVVKLKSGGPRMTVTERGFHFVQCAWFDADNQLHHGEFDAAFLEHAPEPEKRQ